MLRLAVITASDRGAEGVRDDASGPAILECLSSLPWALELVAYRVVPDERHLLSQHLRELSDTGTVDLILTTGGTGLGPRDVTPEATLDVIDRVVPGISEAIRAESLRHTPNAMLSRGAAGVRKGTLIINLPGSPRAVRECLSVVIPVLTHAVELLRGSVVDCARPEKAR